MTQEIENTGMSEAGPAAICNEIAADRLARTALAKARVESAVHATADALSSRDAAHREGWMPAIAAMGQAVAKHFPGMRLEVLGPFGLANRFDVVFRGVKEDASLTVCMRGYALHYVDYDSPTDGFSSGTLGKLNGLNYPEVPVSAALSSLGVAALFRTTDHDQ